MMSATTDRYRGTGNRFSRNVKMQATATTVDVEATDKVTYSGRFNEPLEVEKNPLFQVLKLGINAVQKQ